MKRRSLFGVAIAASVCVSWLGCGGEPTAADAQRRAAEVAARTAAALERVGEVMRANRNFGEIVGDGLGLLPGLIEPRMLKALSKAKSPHLSDAAIADMDATLTRIHRTLSERILVPENLESQSETELVYRLQPQVTCRALDGDDLDPRCVQLLSSSVEVRVVVTTVGFSHRLQFSLGPMNLQPAIGFVDADSLRLRLFLTELKQVSAAVAAALAEPDPLPEQMSGVVDLNLTRTGERGLDMTVALQTDTTIVDPARGFHLTIGGSFPLVTVIASDPFTEMGFAVRPGGIDLRVPWQPGAAAPDGELQVQIAAFDAQGHYREGRRTARLSIDPVDAPSFIAVRGQRVWQLEFARHPIGRLFTLAIAPSAGGVPTLNVRPHFDSTVTWALGGIAGELPEPPPPYLMDETYRLQVSGRPESETGALLEALGPDPDSGSRLVRGSYSFSSNRVPEPVTATEGQCLLPRKPGPEEHAWLGSIQVSDCP